MSSPLYIFTLAWVCFILRNDTRTLLLFVSSLLRGFASLSFAMTDSSGIAFKLAISRPLLRGTACCEGTKQKQSSRSNLFIELSTLSVLTVTFSLLRGFASLSFAMTDSSVIARPLLRGTKQKQSVY